MKNDEFILVGVGEILWGMLPEGRQLGGAPANFAYHAYVLVTKGISGGETEICSELVSRYSLKLIAVTKGPEGSMLFTPDKVSGHPVFEVQIADTVGAGDSFTAVFAVGMLRGHSLDKIDEGRVHGVMPTGSTGEFAALTEDERKAVAEITIDEVNGAGPVVVGTAAVSTSSRSALSSYWLFYAIYCDKTLNSQSNFIM